MSLYLALLHHQCRQDEPADSWERWEWLAYYFSLARLEEREASA